MYARAIDIPEGTHVLVFSLLKEAKELAMDAQKENRLTEDLKKAEEIGQKRINPAGGQGQRTDWPDPAEISGLRVALCD